MSVQTLKEGSYIATWTAPGYETLSAEILVTATGVTCVKVQSPSGGSCGSATAPGVQTTGTWSVFGTMKTTTPTPPPPAPKGYLSVTSTPTGATVDVNGTAIGTTPITRYELDTGSKLVTIRLSGYKPEERTVTITDGDTSTLSVSLTAIPTTEEGYLSVTSTPSGADVSIAGAKIGTTPVTGYGLPAGTKSVTISKKGYESVDRTVTITAGETATLDVSLTEVVAPTTICGWVEKVTVGNLTIPHVRYVYLEWKGLSDLANDVYADLPEPKAPLDTTLATKDNLRSVYLYYKGLNSQANEITGCGI